jgi:WD40 repeat protein
MEHSGNADKLNKLIAKQQWDKITDEDWETLLTAFSEKRDWEQMWRLAQAAPAVWSVRLLLRLKDVAWRLEQAAERAAFTQLAQLAEECHQGDDDAPCGLVNCYATLEGHSGGIRCLAISPGRRILVSGSGLGNLRLWRLPDGKALRILNGPLGPILCIAITPDGQMLISVEGDREGRIGDYAPGSIQMWRLPDGALLSTEGEVWNAECSSISPDGLVLAIGYRDGTVELGSLFDGKGLKTPLRLQHSSISCLAFSPNGRMLASGSSNIVWLWSLPDGTVLQKLKGHTKGITCIAISSNERLLASGSGNGTVWLWDLSDRILLQKLKAHTNKVNCIAISSDEQVLASGSHDNTVRLWRLPNGKALQTLEGHTDGITCIAIGPDGRLLASGGMDGTVRLWALWKVRLKQFISEPTSPEHLKWIEDTLKEEKLTDTERKWLEFVLVLMRWQRRFDFEVGETP